VAPLAHPRGDDTAEVDAGAAVEDALVVGVLALERRLADLRDRDLLTVADDVALDQVRLLQALQSARGGLVRGVESVGDVRTRRLLPTLERAVEGQQLQRREFVVADDPRSGCHTPRFARERDKHTGCGTRNMFGCGEKSVRETDRARTMSVVRPTVGDWRCR
jgi:hypothetical protein